MAIPILMILLSTTLPARAESHSQGGLPMSRSMRRSLWLLIPGLAVVLTSYLAVELFPDTWGGPNIGAGFVLLLGYLAVTAGTIGLLVAYRQHS